MSVSLSKATDFDSDVPEYDVFVDGEFVGSVTKRWFRNGGVQWTNSIRGTLFPVAKTRKGAVDHLIANTGK